MKRLYSNNIAKTFIITLIIIAFIFGILYYNFQSAANIDLIIENLKNLQEVIQNDHQNMLLMHLLIIIILIFLAYSIIGIPLILFYLFFECTSIGFLIASLYGAYKISGIIFGLIYILLCKMPFILCIIYIAYIALKISKKLLKVLIYKENESLYLLLKNLFLKLGITSLAIIIYDLFLYFAANKILSLFLFLLK